MDGQTTTETTSDATKFPTLAEAMKAHIAAAIKVAGGNKTLAATMLGIDRKTLARKLRD